MKSLKYAIVSLLLLSCRQEAMENQPRLKPLAASGFFEDGMAARPHVEHTIARGHLRIDDHFYRGTVDGRLATDFPFEITRADLVRGRERYSIYCVPCHGPLGDGNGAVVRRGYRQPPSFHVERLRAAPPGHHFDVMTRGFGAMPDYAAQVAPRDRWRIAAYIRALQRSQAATIDDVPPERRGELK